MPLPEHLRDILAGAEPEMLVLTTDQMYRLEAYLAHPDGHGVLGSQLVKEADYGGTKYREVVRRHSSFHRYLNRVRDYNRALAASRDSTRTGTAKIRIGAWSELAIGLDESFTPLAFHHPPAIGAPVRKGDGVALDLPGRRWRLVFDLASTTARVAQKRRRLPRKKRLKSRRIRLQVA